MRFVLTLGALLSAALPVAAQTASKPAEPANPNVVKLAPTVTVAQAAARLAAAAKATVVVDPAIDEKVPATYAEGALEPGLARIASLKHYQWRKLHLESGAIPRLPNGAVDAAKLKTWAAALDALPQAAIASEQGGSMTLARRAPATDADVQAWAKTRTPIYVLYDPAPPRVKVMEANGTGGAMRMPKPVDTSKMTPEQVAEAFRSGQPVMMDFEMARKLRQMYPGMLPDIKMDLPEGAKGNIVLMRQESPGGQQIEIGADVMDWHAPH